MADMDIGFDEQITMFDLLMPTFKIDKPIRLIELFGGIGAQAMALRDIGANFEHYRLVEFDKYPVASYNAIHGTDFKPMDIRNVHGVDLGIEDVEHFTYLLTYSFPCQDLSVAGRMKGMKKGSGTRSGLLWEVERLLNECDNLPQVLLMENVPQVHSQENMSDFQNWIDFLTSKGYTNYWDDLNAKDFGVAQNRNRCFMVSLLGEYNFKFPRGKQLDKVLGDYLEEEVDDKYYITSKKAQKLIDTLILEGKILTDRQTDRQTDRRLISAQREQGLSTKQTVSQQDTIVVSQTNKQAAPELSKQYTCHMNYNRVDEITDIAKTLCARDYKGFGTGFDTMNGVIKCEKI